MEPLILSGNVVFADGVRPAEIVVEGATIKAVEERGHGVPDTSEVIFPGFIDIHVHAREFPRPPETDQQALSGWESATRKETFSTAGSAAIDGGVTLYCAMPNDVVPPDDEHSYSRKIETASASPCPAVLFAAVTRCSEPWADLAYKVYLDSQPSSVGFASWRDLEETLPRYRGCRMFFHAEDPEVLSRFAAPGPRWKIRPPEAEFRAVERILELTAKFDLLSHVCHVSTEKAVVAIQAYNRQSKMPVTCEATPHHLFFSVDPDGNVSCHGDGTVQNPGLLECNPPLRSEHDRRFLLEALRDGLVDLLASDHAPHTLDDKRRGAAGMPHLDTLGPFAGWLMRDCGFSPVRVSEILSTAPAKVMSEDLNRRHGVIEPGAAASFSIMDLSRETEVEGATIKGRGPLQTRCGWSPFSGIPLPAAVKGTIILGKQHLFW